MTAVRGFVLLGLLFVTICQLTEAVIGEDSPAPSTPKPVAAETPKTETDGDDVDDVKVPRELFSGKVIELSQALKKRGIPHTEEMQGQVVLETDAGELIPIVSDWRGRAFFQDERLRNRRVDLVGRRLPGVPYLQILMVFTFDKEGQRNYTDYWCDICSIPMYEIKDCECCQGPIRLRFQPQELPGYVKPKTESDKK